MDEAASYPAGLEIARTSARRVRSGRRPARRRRAGRRRSNSSPEPLRHPGPRGRDASGKRRAQPVRRRGKPGVRPGESLRRPGRRAGTEGEGTFALPASAPPGGPSVTATVPPLTDSRARRPVRRPAHRPAARRARHDAGRHRRRVARRARRPRPCPQRSATATPVPLDAAGRRPPRPRCSPSCARSPPATRVTVPMIGLGYCGTVTPPVIRAQRAGEPGLVHRLHAVPAGDQPGPAGGAADLPDHGRRPHRPARSPARRCSTRPPRPPRR